MGYRLCKSAFVRLSFGLGAYLVIAVGIRDSGHSGSSILYIAYHHQQHYHEMPQISRFVSLTSSRRSGS